MQLSDRNQLATRAGATTPLQTAWAARRFTGDATDPRPIAARVAKGGAGALSESNDPFTLYGAWSASGDTGWLEKLHVDAIADKAQHQYMYTEGHWWSARMDQPSDILQRERLGGIALRRNQSWPGHTIGWRFADPAAATAVAIFVPGATREQFRVIA